MAFSSDTDTDHNTSIKMKVLLRIRTLSELIEYRARSADKARYQIIATAIGVAAERGKPAELGQQHQQHCDQDKWNNMWHLSRSL